jgi:glycerol-1-phosphate dehydrogenase [NAD(P)+]
MLKNVTHQIAIPAILEVGRGRLAHMGQAIARAGFKKPVLFLGDGIQKLFGTDIETAMVGLDVIKAFEFDDNRFEQLTQIAFTIPSSCDVILGIGGGRVIDVAKYIAFLNNLPFVSVPTSTSNDSFSSSGCSLYVNGKRSSVQARMPHGIIVDLDIIRSAPEKFIYSGIGDLVSKITAVYDWQFEEYHGRARIDPFAVMIAKKSVNSVVRVRFDSIKDAFFLRELVDSLTMSGIAMEIAASSAPASGSEHLISHALDKILQTPYLHGIQVGVATYLMSLVHQHRFERIRTFLTETGFFEHVRSLGISREMFKKAIDLAPEIKPARYTYIHLEENRITAKRLLDEDPVLSSLLT